MATILENAYQLLTPIIEQLGYEVVEIQYAPKYNVNNLTVFIYKKEGISLDDCETVNNALDSALEQNDITEGTEYVLNISSPGLDRLIISADDFRRSLGTKIEAVLINPIGKIKVIVGELLEYSDLTIKLKSTKEQTIDKSNIKILRPYVKF